MHVGLRNCSVDVGGVKRVFLLYVPEHFRAAPRRLPLWLVAPGRNSRPEWVLNISGLVPYADEHNIVLAGLRGGKDLTLNVGSHSHAHSDQPDDLAYTRAVLRKVTRHLSIDRNRIRCTGYSCGGRFCVLLASELSSFISAIAPVSGIRYPRPNNATRPMPIITFHGTGDPVNPFFGSGPHPYWAWSVPKSVKAWATFNGCRVQRWEQLTHEVRISRHTECHENADVFLVMIKGGGHTWPGSDFDFQEKFQFGHTTHDIHAAKFMQQFFIKHQMPRKCHTAERGEACHAAVTSAMSRGASRNPGLLAGLNETPTFEEVQMRLHENIEANCPKPCPRSARPRAARGARPRRPGEQEAPAEKQAPEGGARKEQLMEALAMSLMLAAAGLVGLCVAACLMLKRRQREGQVLLMTPYPPQ